MNAGTSRRRMVALVAALGGALAICRQRAGAGADRHQVQPRRRQRHAQGQGLRVLRQARGRADQGQGQGRRLRQFALYKDKEEMEALQLGAVQMLAPSLAKFGPLGAKEFEVFDLPFIFDNTAELHKVTQGPVGKQLLGKLDAKGIKGLAFWDNGFKSFSANKALRTPDDFKGMKMRIQSSKVLEAQMRAVGALPQVMAFSEVYQALQTGVVDGTENPSLEPLHAEDARGAEVRDGVRPRLPRLRRHHQQEVLGRPAGRRARPARAGDQGGDRLRQQDRPGRERRRARAGQEVRQEPGRRADRRRRGAA